MSEPWVEWAEFLAVARGALPWQGDRVEKQRDPAPHCASDQERAADVLGEEFASDQRVERRQFAGIGFTYVTFSTPVSETHKEPAHAIEHRDRKEDDQGEQPIRNRNVDLT